MRSILLAGVLSAAAALPARAETLDRDLVPGGKVSSSIFPSGEVETFRVAAPAGSILSVDLGPVRKGAFAPLLVGTLPGGGSAILPPPSRSGRTRAKVPFPADGVLVLQVLAGRGGAGDYVLRTRLRVPKGPTFQGVIAGPGGASFEFAAPAGAVATVTVKTAPGSDVIPTIDGLEGPGGPASAARRQANPRLDRWIGVPQPELGPWTLTVVGNLLTTGAFTGTVRWKAPRGPDEDHRGASDPSALAGPYAALLVAADAASGSLPSLVTGSLEFDGRGRVRTALETRTLAADGTSPLGIGFTAAPVDADSGAYYTDGSVAAVNLDLAERGPVSADFSVAGGGTVLYTAFGPATSPAAGLLLARDPLPGEADLAGSWLYVNAATDGGGASSVEVGTLSLGAGGTVSGIGARTALSLEGGVPVPGDQTVVLRTGSFSVGPDGTVTVLTVPNFVGAPEAWTSKTALRADVLAGLDASGGGGRLFLRQGLGLDASDLEADYLHFGLSFGSALRLRTGILGFDGAGGFAGSETAVDLSGGLPPASGPVTGTYTVNAQGIAGFGIDGEGSGTGIVGPDGLYLFTVSLGGSGVGVDLLLRLE